MPRFDHRRLTASVNTSDNDLMVYLSAVDWSHRDAVRLGTALVWWKSEVDARRTIQGGWLLAIVRMLADKVNEDKRREAS